MTRFALLLVALFLAKITVMAVEHGDNPAERVTLAQATKQPNLEPSGKNFRLDEDVPLVIPADRCIRAIYGPELQKETGYNVEEWDPPISKGTSEWLTYYRLQNSLRLEFCDGKSI